MTIQFLEQLPRIPPGDLPAGSSRMICLSAYGTQSAENPTIESPVRLPCTHHVGLDCIKTWILTETMARNSCPYCRQSFFPAPPRSYRVPEDDPEEAAYREALREIRTRRGLIGGPAPVNGGENHRTAPSLAEPNLALQVMMRAFGFFILAIVLSITLELSINPHISVKEVHELISRIM